MLSVDEVVHSGGYRRQTVGGGERFHVDVPGRLTLDNADLTLQAAREGLGLAYSWRWLAAEHLAAGRLIEVLSGRTPSYGRFRLYYPSRKYVSAGLRAFIDLAREMAPALAIKAP